VNVPKNDNIGYRLDCLAKVHGLNLKLTTCSILVKFLSGVHTATYFATSLIPIIRNIKTSGVGFFRRKKGKEPRMRAVHCAAFHFQLLKHCSLNFHLDLLSEIHM